MPVNQRKFTGKPLRHLGKLAARLGEFKPCFSDSVSQACHDPGGGGLSQAIVGQACRSPQTDTVQAEMIQRIQGPRSQKQGTGREIDL